MILIYYEISGDCEKKHRQSASMSKFITNFGVPFLKKCHGKQLLDMSGIKFAVVKCEFL